MANFVEVRRNPSKFSIIYGLLGRWMASVVVVEVLDYFCSFMGHLSKKEAFGLPPTFLERFPKNMEKDKIDKNS